MSNSSSSNEALFLRRTEAVPRGIGQTTPLAAHRALNAEIWDVEGRRYIDFAGGIGVLNTGHCHPRVMAAVREQMDRFTHTCFQVMMYEPYIELAERLNALAPFGGPAKTGFFTTGAEAAENAIKIARAATGRTGVIAFTGSFHGRTALGMALTGKVRPYKRGVSGPMPDIFHAPFPTAQYGVSVEDALKHLDFLFRADIDPARVAAIIVEPVQGEGGFHPAPPAFMRALRAVCDTHGIVLIADEVQTGFARTGRTFAIEHFDIEPDLVCVAKSLAGGFPLSGVIGRAALMDAADPGGLGGTYAGNPLACAAALAVLDIIEEEDLNGRARAIGGRVRGFLEQCRQRNSLVPIGEVRGLGAMIACDIVSATDSGAPNAEAARRVVQRAYENGLVLLSCGADANTIRVLVPLTVADDTLDEGLEILAHALTLETNG